MSTDVVYSPLCDTDPAVYLAYLLCRYNNGQRVGFADDECRGGGDGAGGGGRGDTGCGFDVAYRALCGAAGIKAYDVVGGGAAGGACGASVGGTGDARGGGAESAVGVSGGDVACGGGVVVGCRGHSEQEANVRVSTALVNARGPNYERNRANRERRRNRVKVVSPTTPKPFYADCDPTRVAELKASRLEAGIAENKARALRAENAAAKLAAAVAARKEARCDGVHGVSPPLSVVSFASSGGVTSASRGYRTAKTTSTVSGGSCASEVVKCNEILEALRYVDIENKDKFEFSSIIKRRKAAVSVINA